MKRSELPSPTRFIRALHVISDPQPKAWTLAPGEPPEPNGMGSLRGKPRHPIIQILDYHAPLLYGTEEGETGVLVRAMLHQDAYGMDDVAGEVLPVSDVNRYITMTLRRGQYLALPRCTWRLRGDMVTDIVELPVDEVIGGTDGDQG
jgi:hypothetical protein